MIKKTSLAIILICSLILSGVMVFADELPADHLPRVIHPDAIAFDDFDHWLENWTTNAIDADFLDMVNSLSIDAAAAALHTSEQNISFSPLTYYFSLAALENGAAGDVNAQLATLLRTDVIDEVTDQSGKLYRLVHSDNEVGRQKISSAFVLNGDGDARFADPFKARAASHLYTESFTLPFEAEANRFLNDWVEAQSEGQIESAAKLQPDERLALISAFTFFDEWINVCDPEAVKPAPFFAADGSSFEIDYLTKQVFTSLLVDSHFKRAELLLKNGNNLVIVLPAEGVDVRDLARDRDTLEATLVGGDPAYDEVRWTIPRFSMTTDLDLKPLTAKLGLPDLFSDDADYTNMLNATTRLDQFRQLSSFAVTEQGISTTAFKLMPT